MKTMETILNMNIVLADCELERLRKQYSDLNREKLQVKTLDMPSTDSDKMLAAIEADALKITNRISILDKLQKDAIRELVSASITAHMEVPE